MLDLLSFLCVSICVYIGNCVWVIDAHGLKIQGGGVLEVFDKIPKGSQGFQEKLPGGIHLFWVLLHLYWQVFRKFAWGCCFIPPHPLCVHLWCEYEYRCGFMWGYGYGNERVFVHVFKLRSLCLSSLVEWIAKGYNMILWFCI